MKTNLAAVMLLHNGEKIKYPWRQAILSVLPIVDRAIIVLAGPQEDDTVERALDFASSVDKVEVCAGETDSKKFRGWLDNWIVKGDWKSQRNDFEWEEWPHVNRLAWPENHFGLSALVNYGVLERCNTKWVFQCQADELFSEDDYDELRGLASLPDRVQAASFGFRHFCGDFSHVFPFVYSRVVRAFRTDTDWHFVGDAVQAEPNNRAPKEGEVYSANVTVNHVGKVHVGREEQAAFKEFDFQDKLYRGKETGNPVFARGDIDPRIEQAYQERHLEFDKIFKEAYERGEVKEYSGPYCKYLREWARELGVELP